MMHILGLIFNFHKYFNLNENLWFLTLLNYNHKSEMKSLSQFDFEADSQNAYDFQNYILTAVTW